MSNDSISNDLYRLNDYYNLMNYYNNYQKFSTPSFRGSEYYTQPQISQTQYQNLAPLSNDIANLSATENLKQTQKKEGISTGFKWGLGIGSTILAGIFAHKYIPHTRVQSRIQRIFLENFTKEEAQVIQKKYQDILKITNKDEFIDKLFTELKKDYKLNNIPIKLDKNFVKGEEIGAIRAAAHFMPNHNKEYLELGVDKTYDNITLLKHMTHELRHAKQDLACYQVSSSEELISVYKDRIKDTFANENWSQKKIDKNATDLANEIIQFYDKIKVGKTDSTNRNYDWGKKILNSYRTYANKSKEAYNKTLYEKDAKDTEYLMDRMVNNRLW